MDLMDTNKKSIIRLEAEIERLKRLLSESEMVLHDARIELVGIIEAQKKDIESLKIDNMALEMESQIAILSMHPTCETCKHNNGYGTCEKKVLTSNRGSPHCPPHTTAWLTYCSAHPELQNNKEE